MNRQDPRSRPKRVRGCLRAALVVVLCVTVGNVAPAFGAIGALLPSDVAVEVDYTVGGEGSSGVTFRLSPSRGWRRRSRRSRPVARTSTWT